MIAGVHTMFYTSEPEALRAFLRDVLQFPATDIGEGWLIMDLPQAEMGCHPAMPEQGSPAGTHQISFWCTDIQASVSALRARGVEFVDEVENRGYGLAIHFRLPGAGTAELYQPLYTKD